jgi:hypothetical protein
MKRLLIAFVFFGFLAALPASASTPYPNDKRCSTYVAAAANLSTLSCSISNNTSGEKILIGGFIFGDSITSSCTETCTFPAGATITHSYTNNYTTFAGFADTTSSHGTFTVTITVHCTVCSGNAFLTIVETLGLNSGRDTGADASAAAASVNYTTAGTNRFVFSVGVDTAQGLVTSNSQIHQSSAAAYNNNKIGIRVLLQSAYQAAAGTYSMAFSDSTSSNTQEIAVLAFVDNGTAVVPTPSIRQSCNIFNPQINDSEANCPLNNPVAGNTIVEEYQQSAGAAPAAYSCTQACTCPAAASATNGSDANIGICYVVVTGTPTQFNVGAISGNITGSITAYEIVGIGPQDIGSRAAANGTNTVNFTTAQNNEWAFMAGGDVLPGGTITPGNSFTTLNTVFGQVQGTLTAQRFITTAGSYTASYTATGTDARPMIAVLAFGPSGATSGIRHRAVEY